MGASLALLAAAFLITSGMALTEDDSENGTVSVGVSSTTAIDITPADLSYTSSGEGSQPAPGDRVFTSDSGYEAVEVENIGSKNITKVWMNSSIPTSNPFGSGTQSGYNSGNWIQVNATGEIDGVGGPDSGFTYVNRVDYNETNDLSYIFTPDTGNWRYGRFKGGNQEYFWAVNASDGTDCTGADTGDVLRVGDFAHNKSATGSNDFTGSEGSSDWTEYTLADIPGTNKGFTDVSITRPDGSTREYAVLTSCGSETYTLRTRYNPTMGGADDLSIDSSVAGYLLNVTAGDSETNDLQPGEHFRLETAVEVPFGVASSGSATTGVLRVLAAAT